MVYGKGDDNMTNNLRSSEVFFKADERNPTIKPKSKRLQVGFKRLSESTVIPTKAHASDSGFDLVASEDVIIEPGETAVVPTGDRKSTRLNSSHVAISYAVFCWKKKIPRD